MSAPGDSKRFEHEWVAERYATARPAVHAAMLAAARLELRRELPVARALDLGAGTGLSTRALGPFARRIVAADRSLPMLRAARFEAPIHRVAARAEALPFESRVFDLVALACLFHWCEAEPLFAELDRVLAPGGALVIYDNGFSGEMREDPGFQAWFQETYLRRFPRPARHPGFGPALAPRGFQVAPEIEVSEWIPIAAGEFARFLVSQSNVIDAVESGRTTLENAEGLLRRELLERFREVGVERGRFRFRGSVFVLQRAS